MTWAEDRLIPLLRRIESASIQLNCPENFVQDVIDAKKLAYIDALEISVEMKLKVKTALEVWQQYIETLDDGDEELERASTLLRQVIEALGSG